MRRIRELSMEAGKTVKVEGKDNNLLELIAADPAFNLSLEDLQKIHGPEEICRPCERADREICQQSSSADSGFTQGLTGNQG